VNPLQFTNRIVIAVGALGVGGSAAVLALGALVGLSESHAGTSAMVWHVAIQAVVAAGALLWSIFVLLTVIWRGSRRYLAALAAAAVSQACLWYLPTTQAYRIVREWTAVPVTVAAIALMSVPVAWWLVLMGRETAGSGNIRPIEGEQ
jgi:hypothetical protein